jgi:hypothetical protein
MKEQILIIFIFLLSQSTFSQSINIAGNIYAQQNREALIGVTIKDSINNQVKAITNEYGFFSFKSQSKNKNTVTFSYVGYENKTIVMYVSKDTLLNILLSERSLNEVIIADSKYNTNKSVSKLSFQAAELKKIPSIGGEPDILRALQYMPGISGSTEGNSNILVRGGTPDQNLILLDGAPVYNVSHLGGFFSVFNADALNKVELYKGAFPARFGGRLSSVLDISMKEGDKKKFGGNYTLGLITSKILLEGPIKKENSSFLFSARSSYLGLINAFKNKSTSDNYLDYWLYDINAKINTKYKGGNLFASIYTGTDLGTNINTSRGSSGSRITSEFNAKTNINWGNLTFSSRYSKLLKNGVFMKILLGYTKYNYQLRFQEKNAIFKILDTVVTEIKQQNNYTLSDKFVRIDFDKNQSETHFFRYGLQMTLHQFLPKTVLDSVNTALLIKSKEFAAYFEDDWAITKNIKFNSGIRLTSYLTDNKTYFSVEPRLAINFDLNQNIAIKTSYSYMQQNVHLLTSGGFGFPNDFWLPATNFAKPERSELYTLGTYFNANKDFDLTIEGFYKKITNLIDYRANISSIVDIQNWEKSIYTNGKGNVWGIEVFLEKKIGKLTGFMGYTYSQNTRQFAEINSNRSYFFDYHRPHDFEIFLNYKLNSKWEFSTTWVYQSGRRITVPIGQLPLPYGTGTKLIFGDKNNAAFPSYQKLDIGINRETKNKKGNIRTWNFSVYNTYNYPNTTFLRIISKAIFDNNGNYLYQNKDVKNVTLFNIIPSFSYTYKF